MTVLRFKGLGFTGAAWPELGLTSATPFVGHVWPYLQLPTNLQSGLVQVFNGLRFLRFRSLELEATVTLAE